IRSMQTRGAPLIGATAAYGVALAMRRDPAALRAAACVGRRRCVISTAEHFARLFALYAGTVPPVAAEAVETGAEAPVALPGMAAA
ncbi:MAG: hypothetical protein ACK4MT_10030, partial [Thermaurantiacus tibetensis]